MNRPTTNAFGYPICEIHELFEDAELEATIKRIGSRVFAHLEIIDAERIVDECIGFAKRFKNVFEYEKAAHQMLEREGVTQKIPEKLTGRADLIYSQIAPYLVGGSVLDLGCGDAKVGERLAQDGREVHVADVYKHPHVDETGLPFSELNQKGTLPYPDNHFDNVLVLTVAHHSDDPQKVLAEAHRVAKPGGRVIVIESVFDVEDYLDIPREQQFKVNMFFDHFYNRVIHYSEDPDQKVNVPFNFNTPTGWADEYERIGLKRVDFMPLAVDQEAVPEFHFLDVMEK